jgi:hypothetical protein
LKVHWQYKIVQSFDIKKVKQGPVKNHNVAK